MSRPTTCSAQNQPTSRPSGPRGYAISGAICALLMVAAACNDSSSNTQGADGSPTTESAEAASSAKAAEDLCSPEGLIRLVPALADGEGRFTIPDPGEDLTGFLKVQQSLANIVLGVLARTDAAADPYKAYDELPPALTFGPRWKSAEIGVATDGKSVSFPDSGEFTSYGGTSFLDGITVVDGTQGTIHQIDKEANVPALVVAQPTSVPCVSRLELAAANTAGTWVAPSYALGPADGDAFLIVDNCIDLAAASADGATLTPNAELFIALQWADIPAFAHMSSGEEGRAHAGASGTP